jgi:hypothetical protein
LALLAAAAFVGWKQHQDGVLTLPFLPPSAATQARLDWEAVDQTDAASLQTYIGRQAPDAPYLSQAQAVLTELEASQFQAAMRAIDAAPIEAFLAAFPNSRRAAEARMRLDRVRGEVPGALIPMPQQVRDAADPLEETQTPTPAPTQAQTEAPSAPAPTPAAPPAPEVRGAPL